MFEGVLVWIWNLPNCDGGDPARIVARLVAAGAAGAIVKGCDGSNGFNDWTQVKALGAALRGAGLRFLTWGYTYSGQLGEATAASQLCRYVQPDAHVFDAEQEMEDLPRPDQAAQDLVHNVRADLPNLPLAYAPIGSIRNHLRAPYRQFTDAGLAMLPQCYYVAFGWTPGETLGELYADVAQYQLGGQPIAPVYEDAPLAGQGSTLADVQAFAAAAKAAGAPGVSVWSYEHLDEAGWQRVAAAAAVFAADPCAAVKQQLAAVTAERDQLAATVAAVRQAVGAS